MITQKTKPRLGNVTWALSFLAVLAGLAAARSSFTSAWQRNAANASLVRTLQAGEISTEGSAAAFAQFSAWDSHTTPAGDYRRVLVRFGQGKNDLARGRLELALKAWQGQDPIIAYWQDHLDLLESTGDREEAVELIQQVLLPLTGDPAHKAALEGRRDSLRGDYPQAQAAYERWIELEPRSAEAYFYLGRSLMAQVKYPQAAAAFERAEALGTPWDELELELATAYYSIQEYPAARQACERAVSLSLRWASAWRWCGRIAIAQKNAGDAHRYLARSEDYAPERWDTPYLQGQASDLEGETAQAVAWFQLSLDRGANDLSALLGIAGYGLKTNDLALAAQALARARQDWPENQGVIDLIRELQDRGGALP